jgi:hypothetical protein
VARVLKTAEGVFAQLDEGVRAAMGGRFDLLARAMEREANDESQAAETAVRAFAREAPELARFVDRVDVWLPTAPKAMLDAIAASGVKIDTHPSLWSSSREVRSLGATSSTPFVTSGQVYSSRFRGSPL